MRTSTQQNRIPPQADPYRSQLVVLEARPPDRIDRADWEQAVAEATLAGRGYMIGEKRE